MNIYEFAETYKISITKARKMLKAGHLNIDAGNPITDAIRVYVKRGKPLSVAQLVALVEEPSLLETLGDVAGAAHVQLQELMNGVGKVVAAPIEVVAEIDEAARGDTQAVTRMLPWLKSTIRDALADEVGHSYLAVRLVLGSSMSLRDHNAKRIARALLNCRQHPGFADWWRIEKATGGNVTRYGNFEPNNSFDL